MIEVPIDYVTPGDILGKYHTFRKHEEGMSSTVDLVRGYRLTEQGHPEAEGRVPGPVPVHRRADPGDEGRHLHRILQRTRAPAGHRHHHPQHEPAEVLEGHGPQGDRGGGRGHHPERLQHPPERQGQLQGAVEHLPEGAVPRLLHVGALGEHGDLRRRPRPVGSQHLRVHQEHRVLDRQDLAARDPGHQHAAPRHREGEDSRSRAEQDGTAGPLRARARQEAPVLRRRLHAGGERGVREERPARGSPRTTCRRA